jgi:hypothetical protein
MTPMTEQVFCVSFRVSGGELAATYRGGEVSYRFNGAKMEAHLAKRKLMIAGII